MTASYQHFFTKGEGTSYKIACPDFCPDYLLPVKEKAGSSEVPKDYFARFSLVVRCVKSGFYPPGNDRRGLEIILRL